MLIGCGTLLFAENRICGNDIFVFVNGLMNHHTCLPVLLLE